VEQSSKQRTRQTSVKQANSRDFSQEEYFDPEYDDVWPTRMPSSARRYYSSDVSSNAGYGEDDIEFVALSEYPSTRPGRKSSSVPARSTATQTTSGSVTQTRRTATQAHMPVTQTRRTATQAAIPTVQGRRTGVSGAVSTTTQQSRRTGTQSEIPAVQSRRTGTQSEIPAIQSRRTGTQSEIPAIQSRRTGTQGQIPVAQSRRTGTQGSIATVQTNRRPLIDTEDVVTRDGEKIKGRDQEDGPRFHWLFYVGMAMLVMTLMWGGLSALNSWWQVKHDDMLYGRPRTYQVDQVVGHDDSPSKPSHFIALNLNRHIEIIEFPGGDPSKAKIYIGPVLEGPGQDLAPVTLAFKDVNGDGKLDMIVMVQDSRFVFINTGSSFRPLQPGEVIHL
jgi:hypothetical protein